MNRGGLLGPVARAGTRRTATAAIPAAVAFARALHLALTTAGRAGRAAARRAATDGRPTRTAARRARIHISTRAAAHAPAVAPRGRRPRARRSRARTSLLTYAAAGTATRVTTGTARTRAGL